MRASDKESPVNFWVLNFFWTFVCRRVFRKTRRARTIVNLPHSLGHFTRPLRHKSKSIQFCTDHGISFHRFVTKESLSYRIVASSNERY